MSAEFSAYVVGGSALDAGDRAFFGECQTAAGDDDEWIKIRLRFSFLARSNAVFQSTFTGKFAIRTPDSARIDPSEPDLEYCAQGWHVIILGVFDDEVRQSLSTVDVQFALDGVSLQTERTAIKKFQHPDPNFSENPL